MDVKKCDITGGVFMPEEIKNRKYAIFFRTAKGDDGIIPEKRLDIHPKLYNKIEKLLDRHQVTDSMIGNSTKRMITPGRDIKNYLDSTIKKTILGPDESAIAEFNKITKEHRKDILKKINKRGRKDLHDWNKITDDMIDLIIKSDKPMSISGALKKVFKRSAGGTEIIKAKEILEEKGYPGLKKIKHGKRTTYTKKNNKKKSKYTPTQQKYYDKKEEEGRKNNEYMKKIAAENEGIEMIPKKKEKTCLACGKGFVPVDEDEGDICGACVNT